MAIDCVYLKTLFKKTNTTREPNQWDAKNDKKGFS